MDALQDVEESTQPRAGQHPYDVAIRLLARREHSLAELERKLAARGHTPDAVATTLAKLVADGYQSDGRFAESFIRSRLGRGQGVLKIRADLRERGIDDDMAATLLDLGDDDWRQMATNALYKRFGESPPQNRAEWAKRARFLTGRGFPSDVVSRVIDAGRITPG